MARLCLLLLIPLLPSLASRLAIVRGRPAPGDSAGDAWRGAASLPADILRQVLELVPRLPVVAWMTADRVWRFVRQGTQQSDWVLDRDINLCLWPRGDRVLTWPPFEAERNVTVWDAWTGRPLQTLQHSALAPGRGDCILDAQVFPAGDLLATLGSDGIVVIWDVVAGEALQHLDVNAAGRPCIIRWPSATQLITYFWDDSCVVIWDVVLGSSRHELRPPRGEIYQLEASPCGSKLATVGVDMDSYDFCLWDAATGAMQWERELEWDRNDWNGARPEVDEVIVSLGGARVVVKVGMYEGFDVVSQTLVVVLNGSTGEPRSRLRLGSRVRLVGLLAGGRRVAAVSSEEAAVWDTEAGERLFSLESDARLLGQPDRGHLVVSPCGQVVAFCVQQDDAHTGRDSADLAESLAVWDGRSGRMLFRRERRTERATWPGACIMQVSAMTVMADEFFD